MRASQPKSEDGRRQELELFDRRCGPSPNHAGLDRRPTRRAHVEYVSSGDVFRHCRGDQPFAILELAGVSLEPRMAPGNTTPAAVKLRTPDLLAHKTFSGAKVSVPGVSLINSDVSVRVFIAKVVSHSDVHEARLEP